MILNNFDHCPLPAARNWFAALASFTATAAFLCALQQSAQVMRWLPRHCAPTARRSIANCAIASWR
jgi:hypothetical protein